MTYDVISHAKKVSGLGNDLCAIERKLGKKPFAESYRNGPKQYKLLLDRTLFELTGDKPSEISDSDRQALGVYLAAQDYIDSKRQLAINLLTCPDLVTLTTADSTAASVIRAIGLNHSLPADHVLRPLVATDTEQFNDYNMESSYLDDGELRNLSWDEFHRWYSGDRYIEGQLATRCLISPVPLPSTLRSILDEVRMCYAFGQMTAIYGLCRGLIETAITDVCVRIGALTKAQVGDDYFFKDFPPAKRINWVLRGSARSEAFALYTATSRVIHGSKAPENTRAIIRRSIALVELLYTRQARQLASDRNA